MLRQDGLTPGPRLTLPTLGQQPSTMLHEVTPLGALAPMRGWHAARQGDTHLRWLSDITPSPTAASSSTGPGCACQCAYGAREGACTAYTCPESVPVRQ